MFLMKCLALITLVELSVTETEFQFLNKLPDEVWVGSSAIPGMPHLNNGGWKLGAGQKMAVNAPNDWSGRFWTRTFCNSTTNHCETGSCGNQVECNGTTGRPPLTMVEITLKTWGTDFYLITLVDGFNVKMSMTPLDGVGHSGRNSCPRVGCDYDINRDCPEELRLIGSNGGVIACKSACNAFRTDQYCCTGDYVHPQICKSKSWQVNYAKFFKNRCPDTYTYAYDDNTSIFFCNALAYLITIG